MQFKGNTDEGSARYWDDLAEVYQKETRISTNDFHYGPLLPGDSTLQLLPNIGPELLRKCFSYSRKEATSKGAAKTNTKSFQGLEKNMPAGSSGLPLPLVTASPQSVKAPLASLRVQCLEIGSGAGQNSIFLAKQGAECVAIDISKEQLAHGRKLTEAENVKVDFQCVSMDAMGDLGKFDLIHSTYALPFSVDPAKVISEAASMLKPGGTFLLTTGHPLYAGEWLEVGDDEDGVFLPDYFQPEPDVRMALDDGAISAARYWPISQLAEWIHEAGLVIERFLEPAPMPIPDMSEKEILGKVPYDSADWRTLYPQLARIPVVVIFKCRKA